MTVFYDDERGPNKPCDLFKFLLSGEYDQGDMAMVSYDDVYDLLHDTPFREALKEKLSDAYKRPPQP